MALVLLVGMARTRRRIPALVGEKGLYVSRRGRSAIRNRNGGIDDGRTAWLVTLGSSEQDVAVDVAVAVAVVNVAEGHAILASVPVLAAAVAAAVTTAVAAAVVAAAAAAAAAALALLQEQWVAVEATTVDYLAFLVVDGNHLEKLLLEALSPAGHALSSFQSGSGQFRFGNHRSRAVEIGSEVVHGR